MPDFTSLPDAVATHVVSGSTLCLEGFTHLIPFAAGHEIIRQGVTDLTLVRMTPDLIYDRMIGMGCARKAIFSWGGNPGVGSLHRFRDAVENGWPNAIEVDERSHAAVAAAYAAGATGLPLGILRGFTGSDLPAQNPSIRFLDCPFTGERLAATPAINPDVTVIHAQKADRKGNVLLWGIIGVQKEAALAARCCIVTVEEIVDDLKAPLNACILPSWVITAICEVPGGASPSYSHGYYERDNTAYIEWDAIAKDRETFSCWMKKNVLDNRDSGDTSEGFAS